MFTVSKPLIFTSSSLSVGPPQQANSNGDEAMVDADDPSVEGDVVAAGGGQVGMLRHPESLVPVHV